METLIGSPASVEGSNESSFFFKRKKIGTKQVGTNQVFFFCYFQFCGFLNFQDFFPIFLSNFFFEFILKLSFPKYFQNSFLVTKRTQVPTSSWRYNPVLYAYLFKFTKNCPFQFLLPQANGFACVDFGCTHPIDGLFWKSTNLLVGFLLKIWMLGNWFNRTSISFCFFGLSFVSFNHEVLYHYGM
jgi:hypothetical protein